MQWPPSTLHLVCIVCELFNSFAYYELHRYNIFKSTLKNIDLLQETCFKMVLKLITK